MTVSDAKRTFANRRREVHAAKTDFEPNFLILDRLALSLARHLMRRRAQPPHLDYGTNGDREIQPVSNMRMRNITLDHLDRGISRDQPCEWGIEWDTSASTYLKEESHLEAASSDFPRS